MVSILLSNQCPSAVDYNMSHHNDLGYDIKSKPMTNSCTLFQCGYIMQLLFSPWFNFLTKSIAFYCVADKIIIKCTHIDLFINKHFYLII